VEEQEGPACIWREEEVGIGSLGRSLEEDKVDGSVDWLERGSTSGGGGGCERCWRHHPSMRSGRYRNAKTNHQTGRSKETKGKNERYVRPQARE
jgi:hypothetical protein